MIWRLKNQQILRIFENYKKTAKTDGNELPDTFKMQFRSADAANRVNRDDLAPDAAESDS